VNVHDHVTEVSVAPVTEAVNVTAWFTTSTPPLGDTVTTTTLPAELPPHPLTSTHTADIASHQNSKCFAALILTVSPTNLFASRRLRSLKDVPRTSG
jgi:hypothetical protein